jgi:uncharacterized membrane protein
MGKILESTRRSLMKTITWRTIVFIDTLIISYLITGNLYFAGAIVSVKLFTGMFWYYVHERTWARINWQ